MSESLSNAPDESSTPEASQAYQRLRSAIESQRDLPPLGDAPRRLASAANDIEGKVDTMVQLALSDPALVIRLLRIVNGSAYETRDRANVVSMHRAITLLGNDEVRHQSTVMRERSERNEKISPMASMAIAQTVFAACFARNLLDTRNPMVSDEGAVAVILSHLPDIVCAMQAPDEVCALKTVRKYKPGLYDSVFRELFATEPGTLGRQIIESWSLPTAVLDTISRSRQRHSPAMAARDWLPIGVGLANDVAQCVRLDTQSERDAAILEIVRRYGHVMDIDTPRLEAMLEQSAYEAISLERSASNPTEKLMVSQLLQPVLRRTDRTESFWYLPTRLDITGVIRRTLPIPAPSIYERFEAPQETDTDQICIRLNRVLGDLNKFIPHYNRAENDGLYRKAEPIPGEPVPRLPTRRERTVSRVGPFLFDGFRMAVGYDSVACYLMPSDDDLLFPAWIAPEPAVFDKAREISIKHDDLISKASQNRIDAYIANSATARIQDRLPLWFKRAHPHCRSFVYLPLTNGENLRGFIIAEHHHVDDESISKESMNVMREIRDAFNEALAVAEAADALAATEPETGTATSTHAMPV